MMATEVNQNFFAWSQEESSVQDVSQGTSQVFGHGSISFGRFDLESLEWEKWSVFTNDRRHEEFGKFNGLVAKKKAYFEEYFKRIRELKALQQQNQQTELNLEYNGDGSDSSQTGEYEPATGRGAPTGSGAFVDDSTERTTAAITLEHEAKCCGYYDNGSLVNDISASVHSTSVGRPQKIDEQMRGNVSGKMDMLKQNDNSSQDDSGMAHEMTPKRIIEKDSRTGQASKIIPKTIKMTSNNVPDHTIVTKGPGSSKLSVTNQMTKPENILLLRRPRETTSDLVGTIARSGITGLRRPSSAASKRPSTRERQPVSRDSSRKAAEVANPFRPSSERRPAIRESAVKHANNATPDRPSTADKRLITKKSAPKQCSIGTPHRPSTADRCRITKESAGNKCNIATPCRPSTADRRPITKESAPKPSNIATPRRPSTADRLRITKESAPNPSNFATPRRPSTADRRPITKESAPKQFASPNRPSTGERRRTTRDMPTKHVGIATSCRPSIDKQRPISREGAHMHADVVTIRRPSTAERRPIGRDVRTKHAIVPPPHRPSTAERRPITMDIVPKYTPPLRPSTAERRPVTRETVLKQANVTNSRWPLTPDRCLTKKSDMSTPRRPSTGERHPITSSSTLKSDPKTPIRLRAAPNYLKGVTVTTVTPQKATPPNLVKSGKRENTSYAKESVKLQVDGNQKSSSLDLPPKRILTSNVRKPNKEDFQDRMQAQAFASHSVTSLQTGSMKIRAPIPPPPPPPPLSRPSCTESRKLNINNSPAGGRKPKASAPHWH